MTMPRTDSAAAALAGDFAAIARIEASLTLAQGARRTTHRGRPDFSRLARYIPDLKV
ncbi:MAG: hypothetical protein H6898_00300 [Rhodobacter sp.]|nr:hypothetical protein [Rhodobacter sp.]